MVETNPSISRAASGGGFADGLLPGVCITNPLDPSRRDRWPFDQCVLLFTDLLVRSWSCEFIGLENFRFLFFEQ